MSAFAGMTKGRVDGKAGRNKNLPKEPVFVKKTQKTPHLEPPDRIHVRYGAEILATGQEEAFDTIHIAKADLNVILPPNLGALVSDIAFVKGSANGVIIGHPLIIQQIFNHRAIKISYKFVLVYIRLRVKITRKNLLLRGHVFCIFRINIRQSLCKPRVRKIKTKP